MNCSESNVGSCHYIVGIGVERVIDPVRELWMLVISVSGCRLSGLVEKFICNLKLMTDMIGLALLTLINIIISKIEVQRGNSYSQNEEVSR